MSAPVNTPGEAPDLELLAMRLQERAHLLELAIAGARAMDVINGGQCADLLQRQAERVHDAASEMLRAVVTSLKGRVV